MDMEVTDSTIAEERKLILEDTRLYVDLINESRDALGPYFDEEVGHVDREAFLASVDELFDDRERAVNVAGLCRVLRELNVEGDYPGFVVDEMLGRKLAATIAGGEPLATLAEATFHFIDIRYDDPTAGAGTDDLHAGIAAGFQTILPGWQWRD